MSFRRLLSLLTILAGASFVPARFAPTLRAQEPTKAELPAYLRPVSPGDKLDLIAEEEMTPLQRVAREMSNQKQHREVKSLRDIQNLLTFDYVIQGADDKSILEEARMRALKAAAGRIYMANYILLGRDLLEPYLKQNAERFIARTTVMGRNILSDKVLEVTLRISVNLDLFYNDLDSKRFIAEPELKPITAVFLQESVDGKRDDKAGGRGRIEQTLKNNLYRVFSDKIRKPALNVDVGSSDDLLREARFEAQRNNVEVIFVGSLTISAVEGKPILYDEYSFYEAELSLKMVRVDNNEVLKQVTDRYSASGYTTEAAIASVLDVLGPRATQTLVDELKGEWGETMFARGQYRLMFDNIREEQVDNIYNWLKTIAPDIKIYKRAFYGGVLVVNVAFPNEKQINAEQGQLEASMRASTVPQFSVRKIDKKRFELAML